MVNRVRTGSAMKFHFHLSVLAVLLVAGCSPKVEVRGHSLEVEKVSQIQPGRTDRSGVLSLLGSPSAEAGFGEPVWYYIGGRTETLAFFEKEVVERNVLFIEFGEDGKVSKIGSLDRTDGQQVTYVDRETPTAGQKITLLEQLIGNIGRFNQAPK
jgi:outer membrane protein assembly factor BamE (lipoprotein component of BamABCDE complex)